MTIQEALDKITPDQMVCNDEYSWFYHEPLLNEFEIFSCLDIPDEESKRIVEVPLEEWYCTDTMVGTYATFLDGCLAAISFQSGRKCDKNYYFVSEDAYEAVYDFYSQFIKPNFHPKKIDWDAELMNYRTVIVKD